MNTPAALHVRYEVSFQTRGVRDVSVVRACVWCGNDASHLYQGLDTLTWALLAAVGVLALVPAACVSRVQTVSIHT